MSSHSSNASSCKLVRGCPFSAEKVLPIFEPLDGRVHLSATIEDGPTYYAMSHAHTGQSVRVLMINTAWLNQPKITTQGNNTGVLVSDPTTLPIVRPLVGPSQTTTIVYVNVVDYGAKGDGVTNDATAVQNAIDAAPVGSTLVFESGKTYLLGTGLMIQKSINVQGNGAKLLSNTSIYPQNTTLTMMSQLGATEYSFSTAVAKGQTSFRVTIPTSALKAGDKVFLSFGQDPNDPNEDHYASVATVISNNGMTLVVDKATPYAINYANSTKKNYIRKVTSLVANVSVTNLVFDTVAGKITDQNVLISRASGVSVDGLSGKFTTALTIVDSTNINVKNISGSLNKTHGSAGRAVTVWQSDGVTITNATVTTVVDVPVIFLESWARNVTITGLTVNWGYVGRSNSDVLHVAGGSSGVRFDALKVINPNSEINLVDSGGQQSSYTFGSVIITGKAIIAPLYVIDDLTLNGKRYVAPVTKTMTFTVQKGQIALGAQIFTGVAKEIKFSLSSVANVSQFFITNSGGQGGDFSAGVVAGVTKTLGGVGLIGSNATFNDLATPTKSYQIFMNAPAVQAFTITITVTYYPT